jgi:hypothetical protein
VKPKYKCFFEEYMPFYNAAHSDATDKSQKNKKWRMQRLADPAGDSAQAEPERSERQRAGRAS